MKKYDTKIINSRPFVNEDGRPLTDIEIVEKGLEAINNYELINGEKPPLEPNFVQWLKEFKDATLGGESPSDFKKNTIVKKFVDYSSIVERTNTINAKTKEAI